jgi:hypothetical protein
MVKTSGMLLPSALVAVSVSSQMPGVWPDPVSTPLVGLKTNPTGKTSLAPIDQLVGELDATN